MFKIQKINGKQKNKIDIAIKSPFRNRIEVQKSFRVVRI